MRMQPFFKIGGGKRAHIQLTQGGVVIKEFEVPTFILNYKDSLNCATILSIKRGEWREVRVAPVNDDTAKTIKAKMTLSPDGKLFDVDTADGQSFSSEYSNVKYQILKAHPHKHW
jgi:hypothetical protein